MGEYPLPLIAVAAVPLNARSVDRKEFISAKLSQCISLLKWPVNPEWNVIVTDLLNDAIPKTSRFGFGKLGKLKTDNGQITFVKGLMTDQSVVFGAARTMVMPYEITIALNAGHRRSALALVHELLHATDYVRGKVLEHTMLHNVAAVIESEILQQMKGYYGRRDVNNGSGHSGVEGS